MILWDKIWKIFKPVRLDSFFQKLRLDPSPISKARKKLKPEKFRPVPALVQCNLLLQRNHATASVTRLDNFWKLLETNFCSKVAQILGAFLGFLENTFFNKKYCPLCSDSLWKILATLNCNIWSHWPQLSCSPCFSNCLNVRLSLDLLDGWRRLKSVGTESSAIASEANLQLKLNKEVDVASVTSKKSPNVYKSWPKMISLEK